MAAPRSAESGTACPTRPLATRLYLQRFPGDAGSARDRAFGQVSVHVSGGCYGDEGEDGRTTAETSIEVYAPESMILDVMTASYELSVSDDTYEDVSDESTRVQAIKQRLEALGYIDQGSDAGDETVWDLDPDDASRDPTFENAILAFKADHGLLHGRTASSAIDDRFLSALDDAFRATLPTGRS